MDRPPVGGMQMSDKALLHKMKVWNQTVGEHGEVELRSHPAGAKKRYKVNGLAYIMGGHTVVVKLEGKSASVAISACKRVKDTADIVPSKHQPATDPDF